MIVLTPKQLREVQLTELELLLEVKRICEKNDIRYNIIAGTLLGAIRHKGYIPWDDDADVAMLRSEYEKFVKAVKKDLDTEKYEFQDHNSTKGYRWGYGKLRRKDTLFLREFQEEMPYFQGIFIDVFPLDYVPDSKPGRAVMNFRCFLVRKLLWARVGKRADKSAFKRLVYSVMDKMPEEKIKRMLNRLIGETQRKRTGWVRILTFPTPNNEYGYKTKWYEKSRTYTFEGETFAGIKDYDAYLSFKFGDYMTLPPEEKRKTHPVSDLKLIKKEIG